MKQLGKKLSKISGVILPDNCPFPSCSFARRSRKARAFSFSRMSVPGATNLGSDTTQITMMECFRNACHLGVFSTLPFFLVPHNHRGQSKPIQILPFDSLLPASVNGLNFLEPSPVGTGPRFPAASHTDSPKIRAVYG